MSMSLLTANGITKTFGTGEAASEVLRGIDIALDPGEIVALTGASGSGKSTLMSVLSTMLRPTGGALTMREVDLLTLDDEGAARFRNRHIGFVFQFHHLLPDFTAVENVLFPAAVAEGHETRRMRERARELLERVGLGNRLRYRPGQLSGGQKQRVAVARALMNRPAIVFADEPTGNLDRAAATQVLDLVNRINAEDGTTFLISTHDQSVADHCARTVHLVDGRVE
ncbi:MAG: ABC transporter ATP-binding protein [Geminicoccaceae bacterium]